MIKNGFNFESKVSNVVVSRQVMYSSDSPLNIIVSGGIFM
jgi:hypothetical protein